MRKAPTGKMDLVVDLNFRMDSSVFYSGFCPPIGFMGMRRQTSNTTDMPSFHSPTPREACTHPVWEAKTDLGYLLRGLQGHTGGMGKIPPSLKTLEQCWGTLPHLGAIPEVGRSTSN